AASFLMKQSQCRRVEARDDPHAACRPVRALEQHHEVVSSHVAREVALRIAFGNDDAGQKPDHLVALPVAELIIEGLEVVQITVSRTESAIACQQSANMFADGE